MPERVTHRVEHPNQWVWWMLHPRLPLAPDGVLRCLITVEVEAQDKEPIRIPAGWYEEALGWNEPFPVSHASRGPDWRIQTNREAHACGPFDSPYTAVFSIAWLNIGETPRGVNIVAQGVSNTGRYLSQREPLYAGDAAFKAHDLVWPCWDVAQMVMLQTGLWLHWSPSERVCELSTAWLIQDPPKHVTITPRNPEPACLNEDKWRSLR